MLEALQDPWVLHGVTALLLLWPYMRILRRAGFPTYYAAVAFLPIGNFTLFFAILALRPWPNQKGLKIQREAT